MICQMSRCCTWLLTTLTFCCVRFTLVYFYLLVKLPIPPSFYLSSLYFTILIWILESLKHAFYITVFQCKPYNGSYFKVLAGVTSSGYLCTMLRFPPLVQNCI